jgi:hypothetical protein
VPNSALRLLEHLLLLSGLIRNLSRDAEPNIERLALLSVIHHPDPILDNALDVTRFRIAHSSAVIQAVIDGILRLGCLLPPSVLGQILECALIRLLTNIRVEATPVHLSEPKLEFDMRHGAMRPNNGRKRGK